MKLKSLVLGAAGIFAVTGAQAADLPPAPEPVDYVRVCDAFGSGFFFIPGTDSCLRLRGRLRTEIRYRFQDSGDPIQFGISSGIRAHNPLFMRARGYWGWDHRTNTDIGLVRAFFRGYLDFDTGDADGTPSLHLDFAFIQIGGLTVGFADLAVEPVYQEYTLEHAFDLSGFSDETVIAQYVYSFGNGFSIAALIFDPSTGSFGSTARNGNYGGLRAPSAGASITYDGSIGTFRLAGIIQDLRPSQVGVGNALAGFPGSSEHGIGWGIGGSGDINIPFGTNTRIGFNVQYSDGIVAWLHDNLGGFFPVVADFHESAASLNKSSGWSAGLGFTTQIAARTTFNVSGSYVDLNQSNGFLDVEVIDAAANIQYRLTDNLVLTAEGAYRNVDLSGGIGSSDAFSTILRAQLDF
ncbi:MAG: porin [Pseudomonadota bacterium]